MRCCATRFPTRSSLSAVLPVLAVLWTGILLFGWAGFDRTAASGPPVTRTQDVVETIHGRQVKDPYRWLEDLESDEVQEWIDEQNTYMRAYLDAVGSRARIGQRLEELLSIGWLTTPEGWSGTASTSRPTASR